MNNNSLPYNNAVMKRKKAKKENLRKQQQKNIDNMKSLYEKRKRGK